MIKINREACNSDSQYYYLVNLSIQVINKNKTERDKYISILKKCGFKAAFYDDGWNNRKQLVIHPSCYNYFNDGLQIGDKIAIGDPHDYKIAIITNEIAEILIGMSYKYKIIGYSRSKK